LFSDKLFPNGPDYRATAARRAAGRQGQGDVGPVKGLGVEKGQSGGDGMDGGPLELAVGEKIEQIVLHLLGSEAIGRVHKVFGQGVDRFQISLLRGRGITAQTQGAGHAIAKYTHGIPPLVRNNLGGST